MTNNAEYQKQDEEETLSLFLKHSELPIDNQCKVAERPDFFIRDRERDCWIGVELREFHWTEKTRKVEGYQDKLLNEACRILDEKSDIKVDVSVYFSTYGGKLKIEEFAHLLVDYAIDAVNSHAENIEQINLIPSESDESKYKALQNEIDLMTIYSWSASDSSSWTPNTASWLPDTELTHQALQNAIDDKQKRLTDYRENAKKHNAVEIWLLLYSVGSLGSIVTNDVLDKVFADFDFETDFDRVFFFKRTSPHYCRELKLKAVN